jgi:hypothetical protein
MSLFFLGCASKNAADTGLGPDFYRGRSATVSSAAYWKVTSCQTPVDCGEPKTGSRWRCVNTSCLAVPATADADDEAALASHAVEEAPPAAPASSAEAPDVVTETDPTASAEPAPLPSIAHAPVAPAATDLAPAAPAPAAPAPVAPAPAESAPVVPAPADPR